MDRIGRLGWIQIDCADPVRLATFWSHVLGTEIDSPLGNPPHYLGLLPANPGEPVVWRVMADPEENEFCLVFSLP